MYKFIKKDLYKTIEIWYNITIILCIKWIIQQIYGEKYVARKPKEHARLINR